MFSASIETFKRRAQSAIFILQYRKSLEKYFGSYRKLFGWLVSTFNSQGFVGIPGQLISRIGMMLRNDQQYYAKWCAIQERISPPPSEADPGTLPKITILSTVTPESYPDFKLAVESVISQDYASKDMLVITSNHILNDTMTELYQLSGIYPWIKLFVSKEVEPAKLWNEGLNELPSESDYVILLEADVLMAPQALLWIAKSLITTKPDYLYTDHDHIDIGGERSQPYFKPDFSPDLLYDVDYISSMPVVSPTLIKNTDPLTPAYGVASLYEYVLRLVTTGKQIYHLPKVLSHRSNQKIVLLAEENNEHQQAYHAFIKGQYGGFLEVTPSHTNHYPEFYPNYAVDINDVLVSIVIPTKDGLEVLKPCVDSILAQPSTLPYEIIILNNNSEEKKTFEWFNTVTEENNQIKIVEASYPFNWSKLNNHGMSVADGNIYILLNNDTTIITPDWIERLTSLALRKDVGIACPLLLYPDNTIQHAGVVVGYGGYADHLYQHATLDQNDCSFVSPLKRRNILAATGACLAISKATIDQIGKFNESFDVCGSDIELCIRAYEQGFLNVYDPATRLYHHESKTRIQGTSHKDLAISKPFYQYYLDNGDPYYNQNFSLRSKFPMPAKTLE